MSRETEPLPSRPFGWKYDLPPYNAPFVEHTGVTSLSRISPAPNHIDSIYLELGRSTTRAREFGLLIGSIVAIASFVAFAFAFYLIATQYERMGFWIAIQGASCFIATCWLFAFYIRMDFQLPRDEPMRFNRIRRKVYVYRFTFSRTFPFSRHRWGVRPIAYNWDDLYASACSVYIPMGGGGLIENITISVRKPGTDEITDRFFFSHNWVEGQVYWTIAQLFMEHGPQALPDFVHPPRDWNNEPTAFDFIPHFAPKVQWPKEMDLESRSAPSSGETS